MSNSPSYSFLKYLNPTWYFHITNSAALAFFPDYEKLPYALKKRVQLDEEYSSSYARKWDAAYQAFENGIMLKNSEPALEAVNTPVTEDQYRFIRRFFHPFWSGYILIIRILSFKNPIRELSAFLRTLKVKRLKPISELVSNAQDLDKSMNQREKVSVVIPTLNRYSYLGNILKDLEVQTYSNFELIVVDQSKEFDEAFYRDFKLNIKLIRQEIPALWQARNEAVQKSEGAYIAFTEDDVRIEPDWIQKHLLCLEEFNADISSGVFYPKGTEIPFSMSYYKWARQFASGNSMLRRSVFEKIGLFDRQFEKMRMGDGEFGMRAHINGLVSVSNPYAKCIDLKASTGGLRESGVWDAFRPKSFLSPRPVPSVLYFTRKYFGRRSAILLLAKNIGPSLLPYSLKRSTKLYPLAYLLLIILSPLVLYQVMKSWRIAGRMLEKGPLIDKLRHVEKAA